MKAEDFSYVECTHQDWHMQGFSKSEDYMYWSFTNSLVKTNMQGTMMCQVRITGGHLGDIDYHDGKIYASYLGMPLPGHEWGDWSGFKIYVFDAEDLKVLDILNMDICDELKKVARTESDIYGFRGIDGVAIAPDTETGEDKMFVACATWPNEKYKNEIIFKCDMSARLEKMYLVPTGNTMLGIQTLDYDADNKEFWFTTYGPGEPYQPKETLYCVPLENPEKVIRKYTYASACGLICLGKEGFYASVQFGKNGSRGGIAFKTTEDFFKEGHTEKELKEVFGVA